MSQAYTDNSTTPTHEQYLFLLITTSNTLTHTQMTQAAATKQKPFSNKYSTVPVHHSSVSTVWRTERTVPHILEQCMRNAHVSSRTSFAGQTFINEGMNRVLCGKISCMTSMRQKGECTPRTDRQCAARHRATDNTLSPIHIYLTNSIRSQTSVHSSLASSRVFGNVLSSIV